MRKAALLLSTVLFLLFMSGCGGQTQVSTTPPPSSNLSQTPVGLSLTDSPPSGVVVLFFQMSITGATLTNSSTTPPSTVSLLSSANPIPVNVSQLQTMAAFLGNQNVPSGDYSQLSLNFANNPQLTIFNASNTSLASACPVGQVCELTPSMSPLTLNFTNSPFPINLTASSPLAFMLDVNLDTVLQSALTSSGNIAVNLDATNGVTVSEVKPETSGGPIHHLGELYGTIQTITTTATGSYPDQFTLQTLEGRTFTIDAGSSTTYSNFPSSSSCTTSAESFGCLATGDVVGVTVTLQSDGSLLADSVNFIQLPTQQTVQGTIIGLKTSTANNTVTMDLIIQKQPSAANADALPVGKHAAVIVPTGSSSTVTYAIDWTSSVSGFTPPTWATVTTGGPFSSASDLQVGQTVQVVVAGTVTDSSGSSGGPVGRSDITFTASSITLEPSQITGTVASLPASGATNFTLATMQGYFVPPSPSANPGGPPPWGPVIITVDASGNPSFTNFPTTDNLAGLAINDVVSLHCWVFLTPTSTSFSTAITVVPDTVLYRGMVGDAFF